MPTAHLSKVKQIQAMVDAASRMLKVQRKAKQAGKQSKMV